MLAKISYDMWLTLDMDNSPAHKNYIYNCIQKDYEWWRGRRFSSILLTDNEEDKDNDSI